MARRRPDRPVSFDSRFPLALLTPHYYNTIGSWRETENRWNGPVSTGKKAGHEGDRIPTNHSLGSDDCVSAGLRNTLCAGGVFEQPSSRSYAAEPRSRSDNRAHPGPTGPGLGQHMSRQYASRPADSVVLCGADIPVWAVLMLDALGAYGASGFGSYIFQVVFHAICAITGFAAQAMSHPHWARRRAQYWLCGWALAYGTHLALRTFPGPFWHVASIVSMLSIADAGVRLAWKHPGLFESGAKP